MRAIDTNGLVRLVVADDRSQAQRIREVIEECLHGEERILVMEAVFLELAWVLGKKYAFTREELCFFFEKLLSNPVFFIQDAEVIAAALEGFRHGGGFADHLMVAKARKSGAASLLSFDRKLHKIYPDFVLQP